MLKKGPHFTNTREFLCKKSYYLQWGIANWEFQLNDIFIIYIYFIQLHIYIFSKMCTDF